ncbi:hypothetical protein [Granulicoccus phenolivorans]|uniref:hypothetical protein n=1 Tax=Granulicoccus phenolivorans TaxID=266854 RepID=UPI00040343CF|nr:hypothetical protein [Granulicoccus phenolivorans]
MNESQTHDLANNYLALAALSMCVPAALLAPPAPASEATADESDRDLSIAA